MQDSYRAKSERKTPCRATSDSPSIALNPSKWLAVSIFFLSSLDSFGGGRYVALGLVLGMSALFIRKWALIRTKDLLIYGTLVFAFTILAIASSLGIFTWKHNDNFTLWGFVAAFAAKCFIFYAVYCLCCKDKRQMADVIGIVCLVHLLAFIVQFLVVYSTGLYIDLLEPFTGISQRYQSNIIIPVIGAIYRPTGFFLEPSTYATFVLIFVVTRLLLNKKADVLDSAMLVSGVLTFSLAAAIYCTVALVLILFDPKAWKRNLLWALFLPVILYLAYGYSMQRYQLNSGSFGGLRTGLIDIVFEQPLEEVAWGNGVLGLPSGLVSILQADTLANYRIAAINDSGLWLYMAMKVGMIGLILYIAYFYFRLRKLYIFALFTLVLITKVNFFSISHLFLFLTALYFEEDAV